MKKIISSTFFIFLMFITALMNNCAVALEYQNEENEKELMKNEHEVIFEEPILLDTEKTLEDKSEKEVSPYTKKALKAIIEKEYSTDSTEGLFKKQLSADFQHGLVKNASLQGNFIFNMNEKIDKEDSDFKFNTQLINLGFSGDFRSGKEGYNFLFDLTPNIHDNFFNRVVLDAYIETKRIKNNTLMFGASRPSVGYEGGMSSYLVPFLARSQTARHFGNARKTGVRLKGDYKYVDYDIGGYSSDTYYKEFMPGVETNIWVNLKPFENIKEKYGTLNIGGGIQAGDRNSTSFFVYNTAVRYNYKKLSVIAEYQDANGSNGSTGLSDKKRNGYNLTLAYKLTKKLEVLCRYDNFDNDKKIKSNDTREYTAGINYYIFGQAMRLMFNYIFAENYNKSNSHKFLIGTQFLI